MGGFELFLLIYIVIIGLLYMFASKGGVPWMLPGDIYIAKGTRNIYIPLGTSLIITVLIFLILNHLKPR